MKKWVSILLLSLYLVSTTELNQLLKLPILVEHYIEHKGLNPEMTFTEFLKIHYDHPVKDSDYKTDQKLPFADDSFPLALVFTVNPDFSVEIKKQIPCDHPKVTFSYSPVFYHKDAVNSIWQPPKNC